MPNLTCLPRQVLKRIFDHEPSLVHVFLVGLSSKALHELSREIVYETISLDESCPPSVPSQLATILEGPECYGAAVRRLRVETAGGAEVEQTSVSSDCEGDSDETDWPATLSTLLCRLPNLRTFSWGAARVPPIGLAAQLGLHCPSLEAFVLEIPSAGGPGQACRAYGRRRAHTNGSPEEPDSDAERPAGASLRPLRWDADAIEGLPPSLTELGLSSLSASGAKSVSRAFEALTWPGLTKLRLSRSLFIDDDLIAAVVLGSKKIKSLTIESMGGTKLTERGVEHLFNGLDGLEEIELFDVEGRFSKNGWLKFDDLPTSLRSIKFKYHETGSYHSWTLDHLQTLVSLLGLYPNALEQLSVARCVPLPALVPGRHAMYPELAASNRTVAKRLTKEQIMTIVEEGKSLRELTLDWWLISVEGLEVIVKGLPNLARLTVLVDGPFHRIIASTAFVHSRIKTLTVSIPPEHTPLVQELSLAPITPTHPPLSPTMVHSPPALSPGLSTLCSPVPTRDLKKFIKRAGHLKEIVWTGRGGLGTWRFSRNSGSAVNVKVEFVPITDQLPPEAVAYETQAHPQQTHHHRAGSSSRFNSSTGSGAARQGVRIGSGGWGKRRTSSIAANEDGQLHEGKDYSRRSSSASLATSWSSGCPYLTGSVHRVELEEIPGTPAGEREEEVEVVACQKGFGARDREHDGLVVDGGLVGGPDGIQDRLFGLLRRDEELVSTRLVN